MKFLIVVCKSYVTESYSSTKANVLKTIFIPLLMGTVYLTYLLHMWFEHK